MIYPFIYALQSVMEISGKYDSEIRIIIKFALFDYSEVPILCGKSYPYPL